MIYSPDNNGDENEEKEDDSDDMQSEHLQQRCSFPKDIDISLVVEENN
jgi:hypothetical protein